MSYFATMRKFSSLSTESSSGYLYALVQASSYRQRRCYKKKETLMLLFPYFVDLIQIKMSERVRDWHCRLLSLVNFGAFKTKRPQWKQVQSGRTGRVQLASECMYIYTSRQLEAPSRPRCRRCLRILAIFRPAASDEATCNFLFSLFMSHAAISPVPRRGGKWQLLRLWL